MLKKTMRHPAKEQENICHHSTKIVNKNQWKVDEFVNSPLPEKFLSNWFSKHLPQISCASCSSTFKFLPCFISFPNLKIIFCLQILIFFSQLASIPFLEDVRDKKILGYGERQSKSWQRVKGTGSGSRKGKLIFWPVLVLRGCLKVSSKGILQMWPGSLDLICWDKK